MIEEFYDLKPQVLALDRQALDLCRAPFAHVEEIRDYILPLIQGEVPQFRNEYGFNEYITFMK